ncbi:IclR family transcriptional regulator [Roseomonas elaeocarpi]|uniref:IclR family transcriptional regulator n=1 Tax=Roseomonas elaeocarpi TaxID=907779 RepID=A0ABV6JVC8_9PROT
MSGSADNGEKHGIQVIARAATILRVLADGHGPRSLGAIARRCALPRSTVQRIVTALEAEQLVEGGPEGVRLGEAVRQLAGGLDDGIAPRLRPALEALSRRTGETVVLSRMRGRETTAVDQVVAECELRVVFQPGHGRPLSCMASGKALLALMTDAAVERLLGPDLPRPTPGSPADLPALLRELAAVRREGVAFDRESHSPGVCAVAAVVGLELGRPHAVSVVAPTARFVAGEARLREALAEARPAMEAALR